VPIGRAARSPKKLGVSKSTAERILAQVKPSYRLERDMAKMARNSAAREPISSDSIEPSAVPPYSAWMKNTPLQALDRLDPVLLLSPCWAQRHGFEYLREGTLSYVVLSVKTGIGEGNESSGTPARRFSVGHLLRNLMRCIGACTQYVRPICWTYVEVTRHIAT
jgi:hypothetical protein